MLNRHSDVQTLSGSSLHIGAAIEAAQMALRSGQGAA
jgi:hypothetical protein